MNKAVITIGLAVAVGIFSIDSHATGDLTRQDPIEITVQLGSPTNELRFIPSTIELETGKLYRIVDGRQDIVPVVPPGHRSANE